MSQPRIWASARPAPGSPPALAAWRPAWVGFRHEVDHEHLARAFAVGLRKQQSIAFGREQGADLEDAVMRTARYIESNFDSRCTLDELAAEAGMSSFHFLRVYRRVTGQTPYRHIVTTRLRHAARRLRATQDRIAHIAAAVGFGDLSTFNASFMRAFGVSPGVYRRRYSAAAAG